MAYISPFDDVIHTIASISDKKFKDLSERTDYSAKLSDILEQTRRAYNSQDKRLEDRLVLALHPTRMIRAAIDVKIYSKESDDYLALIRQAISIGLSVYGKHEDVISQIGVFEDMINKVNPDMLKSKVTQLFDSTTWISTHPRKSEVSARVILEETKGKDILMIALAHGGVGAGMDVFGMYNDACASERSSFYAVRLSTDKMRDEAPRVDLQERLYLQQQAEDRAVVIFDEDSSSGKTINTAKQFFKQLFDKEVIARVNNTIR